MTEHCLSQVEDQLAAILSGSSDLAGKRVGVLESPDVAIEDFDIIIATANYSFDVADENWMTLHTADIDIEVIGGPQAGNTINRENRNTLSAVLAAIHADRSLGLGLQDIQEIDVAPAEGRGKDVGSASLRFRVQWFTPRGNWFTIV